MSLWLGLRLAAGGGRETLVRLAFMVAGVGVGTTLLLLALTGQSAVQGRADRTGWQSAAYAHAYPEGRPPAPAAADGALFLAVSDYHDGVPMTRAYVAALGDEPPVPPGLDRLPGPGEVAVSPALRRLLESTPDDELDDRFPGRDTMTIGDAGLAHPEERVALIGRTPDQLRGVRSVQEVRTFDVLPSGYAFFLVLRVYLLVGAMLLLVPVVILIVMATRISAARREQRFAAIRLAGATRGQTAAVAATETGIAAVAGTALAWLAYEGGRRFLAATVSHQGGRFFVADVAVEPLVLALVLVGVPVLAVLTTIVSLNRVQVSPLGISRRARRAPPSAWNAAPLVVGISGTLAVQRLDEVDGELSVVFGLLTVVGLVLIGPWLCLLAGRALVRMSRRAPALIAARRIAADPRATFGAISGVVLAAMTITFLGSTLDPPDGPGESRAEARLKPGVVEVGTGGVPEATVAPLLSGQTVVVRFSGSRGYLVPCADLARVELVTCPHAEHSGRAEPVPGADNLPVMSVYIPTDGTPAAERRVRTEAANLVPNAIIHTQQDMVDREAQYLADLQRLLRLACLFVLLVGACSLIAGTVGGLIERRRPFALLHASGVRVGELRQVVFLETAATMVLATIVGVGLGLLNAFGAARAAQLTFRWPDPGIYAILGSGVLATLILSTLALPLLNAASRYEALRYE